MTIWDLLPQEKLEDIQEDEMVKRVGDAIGVVFQKSKFGDYEAKDGRCILSICYDHYDMTYCTDLFIGVGLDDKRNHIGAAGPVDNIQDAIDWFERKRKR